MEFHTFGPGLALDPLTMRGVPAMTVYLEDADTGDPVQAYTMDADPAETTVRTNRFGYFPQFQVDAAVRRLRIVVGEVELIHGAWELIYKAEANTEDAVATAQAAQAAAEHAASMIEAPADIKVAELIDTRGTATQRVLHGLYGARGNTFVQPTPPPAGITYEWAGARGASDSIKKIDGVEVARNIIPSPRIIDSSYTRSNIAVTQDDEEIPNFITTTGTGTGYVGKTQNWVTEGQFFATAVSWNWGEGIGRVRHQIQFRGPNQESISAPQQPYDRSEFPGGGREIMVYEIPSGAVDARIYTWFYLEGAFTTPPVGSTIRIGEFSAAAAATELDAERQVRSFFDGDMPDDHANDVWFNTTDNREYIWDSDTKEWQPRSAPGLDDAGIAALIEDTNSETRGQLETAFGATSQNTITAAALQAPGPVRDAIKDALRHYGAARAEGSPGTRLVFGALRNYGSAGGYWQPIDDNGHDPVGIASVTTTDDRITINTTPVDNGTIVGGSLIAVTDETLAKQGYFVGGSGGGGTTHLMLGRSFEITERVWWDGNNWQFERGDIFTFESWASGHLRLNHNFVLHGRGGVNINWHATTASAMVIPVITAERTDQTVVNFYTANGTRLTTPTTACRFYLTRHESRDEVINPKKVDHPSGNIWFMLVQTYR